MMLVLCIGFISCSDDSYESRIHELLIDSKKLVFEATEDEGELESTIIFRNEDVSNYKANPDADWCTVYFTDSTSSMTIKVTENNTFDERKSTVTLLDKKDGVSSRSFVVTQKQNNVIRVVGDSTIYEVKTDGGKVVVNLESNVSYEVQIPSDVDWITLPSSGGTRGLQQSQVVLEVARNTSEKSRSAQVDIKDETTGAMTAIFIKQYFDSYLRVAEKDFTIDELGGEISIYIETNISFDFYTTAEDTWVKKKGNRETINDVTVCQKVSIAPFTEKSPKRTSTISVENASFSQQVTVNITQTRNLYIVEESGSVKILSGSSQKLTLYNAENEAVYWKSEDESVATVDDEGTVTGVAAGSTAIWVYSSDGMHSDYVTVTIEKPEDQNDKINKDWQPYYTQHDDVSVLSKLVCTLTNNSDYDLIVSKATLYSDDVVLTSVEPQGDAGVWSIGKNYEFKAEISEEYVDSVVTDTIDNGDGTVSIHETTTRKYKENTHQYLLMVEYKHSSEVFTYMTYWPEKASSEEQTSSSRKKAIRRNRRR